MKFATCAAITLGLVCAPLWTIPAFAADDGIPVNRARYADHPVLPDFTAPACPDNPRGLEQVKGNLYRHTTGAGLAVHSGLVLATGEGALIIDPAMTCTATWLRDEIKRRFNVGISYVVYTHAHAITSAARRCTRTTVRSWSRTSARWNPSLARRYRPRCRTECSIKT